MRRWLSWLKVLLWGSPRPDPSRARESARAAKRRHDSRHPPEATPTKRIGLDRE